MALPPKSTSEKHVKVPIKTEIANSVSGIVTNKPSDAPVVSDADNAASTLANAGISSQPTQQQNFRATAHVPAKNLQGYELILDQHGMACASSWSRSNRRTYRVGTPELNKVIRQNALKRGIEMKRSDVAEFNEMLRDQAEAEAKTATVHHRVAPYGQGIEIDVGDDAHTVIRIQPGSVEVITEGSESYFHRSKPMRSLVIPTQTGDLARLRKYVNVDDVDYTLLLGWITNTIALPKIVTSNFVHPVLGGGQGVGKTELSKLLMKMIDPSIVGVQVLPGSPKDLAIAAKFSHLLCYDNIRAIRQSMSDAMCIAANGGAISTRALYSDDAQFIIYLHCALILNGLHGFLTEPDLAQRVLPIQLKPMDEKQRKSEAEMERELDQDLPYIMRGLYDLIAAILGQLPDAEITSPERMIDFVRWLAAMEAVQQVPGSPYQIAYSHSLEQAQLDSLLENPLAAAVVGLVESLENPWSGEPTELLEELGHHATTGIQRSNLWPKNAIQMSKRLQSFQASLGTQGISIIFERGKKRRITITTTALGGVY